MNGLSCSIPLPQYHEVEADGHTYLIDGRVTVQFNWVDFGIGAYEFWGRTGYDSSFGPEDTVITDVEIDASIARHKARVVARYFKKFAKGPVELALSALAGWVLVGMGR